MMPCRLAMAVRCLITTPAREARAAGGVLDVGDILRVNFRQLLFDSGECVERFGCVHHANVQARAGFLQERQVTLGGDANDGIAGFEQQMQLRHVGAVGAHLDRCRQCHGNQAGVLAGVEEADEIRIGFSHQRHAVALVEAQSQKFVGQVDGL